MLVRSSVLRRGSVTEAGVRAALTKAPPARRQKYGLWPGVRLGRGLDVITNAMPGAHSPKQMETRLGFNPIMKHAWRTARTSFQNSIGRKISDRKYKAMTKNETVQLAPTPWGTQFNAEAVRRPDTQRVATAQYHEADVYLAEPEEVVKTISLADGLELAVKVGDLAKASEAAICGWVDGLLGPRDTASAHLVNTCGEDLAAIVEEHSSLFGPIPKGYVGSTPAPALGADLLVHCNPPEWMGGDFHEARWLSMSIQHVLEECAFNAAPSLAIRGRVIDWPAAASTPLFARTFRNWADGEHTHGTSIKSIAVYFETKAEAEQFCEGLADL